MSPNPGDAELAATFLRERGIEAHAFASLAELAPQVDARIGCVVVVDEALVAEELPAMREALARLPAWLDLPLVFVARDMAQVGMLTASAFPESGNVTFLERPLNPHALVSAVAVALRAWSRQREVGELLAQREEAVRLRDEFMAMLAHELRNPLAPMRNALHMMRLSHVEDPTLVTASAILDRQVDHIVHMVDDLMDVARLERGKVQLQMQRVDLNKVVGSALETSLHAVRERGHRLSMRLSTEALPARADPVRVEQIVCNLVNNAAKFTPAPGEITVETSLEGAAARIEVRDTGVGFLPETADKLFAPFLQMNPTLDRSAGGLGIGLTIVRRLADLHGGSVEASSEGPGRGSRFVVRLPLAAGEREAPARQEEPAAPRRRCRVVVIEDNADIRATMHTLLTHWGHEVEMEPDGPSGLARVLAIRPDVAVVDIGLPGLNGYEVARGIREKLPRGKIRLIAITGYGQPAERERALAAGFDVHLLKPVAPEVLEREVAR